MSKRTSIMVKSKGSALIIALVFLLILTLVGVTAMQGTSQQETMAGNMRDHNLAFQAAEAALRAGERWLQSQATAPVLTGTAPGLMLAQSDDFWETHNWDTQSLFTNNTMAEPTGSAALTQLSGQPRYVIEDRTVSNPPNDADFNCGGVAVSSVSYRCYRITARGLGGSPNAIVILQSTFYRL